MPRVKGDGQEDLLNKNKILQSGKSEKEKAMHGDLTGQAAQGKECAI